MENGPRLHRHTARSVLRLYERFFISLVQYTRRVRPPNGGRNEANSWETGSEYSSGETYTAAAMRAAGRRRPRRAPAPACGLAQPAARAGPCTLGYTNVVAVALAKTAAIVRKCAFSPICIPNVVEIG